MKHKLSKPLKSVKIGSRLHSTALFVAVALTAVTGVATLHFSLAASSDISITVTDTVKYIGVPGVGLGLSNHTPGEPGCSPVMIVSTDDRGVAAFTNCSPTTVYEISHLSLESRGYTINSDSEKHLGSLVMPSTTWYSITVHPTDTDGDGVPNNTPGYTHDNCPNQAGPGGNSGCPLPVVTLPSTPTTPTTPSTPSPGSSSTPNSTPTNGSSGGSTKATTTTTKAVSKASTPAIVVSTGNDKTPPTLPAGLSITVDEDSAYLSWLNSTDNTAVVGYNIERSTDQKQWTSIAEKITHPFYTNQGLESGKHYYYRVRAVDAAGNLSEGALVDIKVVAYKTKSSTTAPTVKKSKQSSSKIVPVIAGVLLLAIAAFASYWLFRRHLEHADDANYGAPVPSGNPDDYKPAPHTSISLADMVMEDMRNRQHPPVPSQALPPVHPVGPQQPSGPAGGSATRPPR